MRGPELRSRVTDGKLSEGRTSSSTFLTGSKGEEPIVRTIEQRIIRAVRSAGLIAARRLDKGTPQAENTALTGKARYIFLSYARYHSRTSFWQF